MVIKDISKLGIFNVSSAKSPQDFLKLTDGRLETFWQSDGPQPHKITVTFPFRVKVDNVQIYVDFRVDESYTPSKISISAGTCPSDLVEIICREFEEPVGWLDFETLDDQGQPIKTNFLQISIIANHQNGKDTHVRLVRITSPQVQALLAQDEQFEFKSSGFTDALILK